MSALIDAPRADQTDSLRQDSDRTDQFAFAFRPTPIWKRAMDLGLSCVLLAALLPVFLAVAAFIRCISRGPVFFVQSRVGANGRRFRMWKFRTMTVETDPGEHLRYVAALADSSAPLKKLDLRSRLIPGGALLRATAVDELPQLFNVLKGDMSLIGPRPDVLDIEDYQPWQRRRFAVVPGISGLWQVSGKNNLTFDEMLELDVRYVEQRSLLLDLAILFKTVPVVLGLSTG